MTSFFLTVDGGNTLTKYALFDGDEKLLEKIEVDCASLIEKFQLTPKNTVVAQVNVARPRAVLNDFKILDVADYYKNSAFLDMPVDYSETLGLDRLIFAYELFNGRSSTALVDSGTFTTVDLVTADGFQGGHILPGLEFLTDAYDFGYLLQKMRPEAPLKRPIKLPKNSADAMASGLTLSFFAPIESALADLQFDSLCITGGRGDLVWKYLETSSAQDFLQQGASILFDSDLIHKGLLKFLRRVI